MGETAAGPGAWATFVLLTILMWGSYGVLLHTGQAQMGDPAVGRYKAFLFVGIAYVVVAILAPVVMLVLHGADWSFSGGGMAWSLVAGAAGAIGAFGVLLAFGQNASPAVVMSLVFCGAPIVNAAITITLFGLWSEVRWQFVAGILLAALGAYLVVAYKPAPTPRAAPPPIEAPET